MLYNFVLVFAVQQSELVIVYIYFGGSYGEECACNVGDLGLIPGLGRSPGKGMATHSGICACRIPMHREAWRTAVHGLQRVGHDEQLSTHTCIQFSGFPSHLGHHRALRRVPCAI